MDVTEWKRQLCDLRQLVLTYVPHADHQVAAEWTTRFIFDVGPVHGHVAADADVLVSSWWQQVVLDEQLVEGEAAAEVEGHPSSYLALCLGFIWVYSNAI